MTSRPFQPIRDRYPLFLFLIFYFIWTLFTYQDFGETWDESGVYTRGIAFFHYLRPTADLAVALRMRFFPIVRSPIGSMLPRSTPRREAVSFLSVKIMVAA